MGYFDNLEDELFESIKKCNVCNIALTGVVEKRKQRGESVKSICEDIENAQRQLIGEIFYSACALRSRYNREMPAVRNEQRNGRPTKLQQKREKTKTQFDQEVVILEELVEICNQLKTLIEKNRKLGDLVPMNLFWHYINNAMPGGE